jgi:Zn-dependent peptidase ImmA (M78 family)
MSDCHDRLVDVLLSGIDVARRVAGAHVHCPQFPRNIELTLETIRCAVSSSAGCDYKITVKPMRYGAKRFRGNIEVHAKEAAITYDIDDTMCWRRFVVAKELCHLLFTGSSHASSDADVESLISSIFAGIPDLNDNVESSEVAAMLMALEVMLPHSERASIEGKLNSGATVLDVATAYRVPQQQVVLYLSPNYTKLMDSAYDLYDLRRSTVRMAN